MAGWVQNIGNTGSAGTATTLVLTIGTISPVPVGDYIFVAVEANASAASWSMTDSRSNTYTLDKQESAASPFTGLFKTQVSTQVVTGDTITFTTTSQGGRAMTAASYTGLATGTLDQSSTNSDATGTATSLAVTDASPNSTPNCLVLAAFGISATTSGESCATGYTLRPKGISSGTIREVWIADKVVTATETSSATMSWTTAGRTGGLVATYAVTTSQPVIQPVVVSQAVSVASVW